MLTTEGMEELRALGAHAVHGDLRPEHKGRIRELLGELDATACDWPWQEVEHSMFLVLGIYNIGRLGYDEAMRRASKALQEGGATSEA